MALLRMVACGCGGGVAAGPASTAPPAAEPEPTVLEPTVIEPTPPALTRSVGPDPWATDLAGDAFEPAAPAPWAAVMRPGAAWTLRSESALAGDGGHVVRVTVEAVTKEAVGHVAVLRWESRELLAPGAPAFDEHEEPPDPDRDDALGQSGTPRRLAVGPRGVWWDSRPSGAWAKRPTFTPRQVKQSQDGATLCLDLGPPPDAEACGDETCSATLCVHPDHGIVAGDGRGWPRWGRYASTTGIPAE